VSVSTLTPGTGIARLPFLRALATDLAVLGLRSDLLAVMVDAATDLIKRLRGGHVGDTR
jgi:hypothetical protein